MDDAYVEETRRPRDRRSAYLEIYGRPVTGAAKRRKPAGETRQRILTKQNNLCLYCGLPFGSKVARQGKVVALRLNWDHFIPYAYAARNAEDNWIAACHVCNGIKLARMFSTVIEAQQFIRSRWAEKGYELVKSEADIRIQPEAVAGPGRPTSAEGDQADVEAAARTMSERILQNRRPATSTVALNSKKWPMSTRLAALKFLVDGGYVRELHIDNRTLYQHVRTYKKPRPPRAKDVAA